MSKERRPPTILVVDDDVDHCLMLEVALESLGYRVVTAHSVEDAIAALATHQPDGLVCDLTLGDGTALDVMRRTSSHPKIAVVLSGFDEPEDRERSLAAGFDAHLVKPTPIAELGNVLASGLRRTKSGVHAKTLAPLASTALTPPKRGRSAG